jgi:outer membrane biogenesis lipoprotein LolB
MLTIMLMGSHVSSLLCACLVIVRSAGCSIVYREWQQHQQQLQQQGQAGVCADGSTAPESFRKMGMNDNSQLLRLCGLLAL